MITVYTGLPPKMKTPAQNWGEGPIIHAVPPRFATLVAQQLDRLLGLVTEPPGFAYFMRVWARQATPLHRRFSDALTGGFPGLPDALACSRLARAPWDRRSTSTRPDQRFRVYDVNHPSAIWRAVSRIDFVGVLLCRTLDGAARRPYLRRALAFSSVIN